MDLVNTITSYAREHGPRFLETVGIPWLRIPTISPEQGFAKEVRQGAEFISGALSDLGLSSRLIEVDGLHPLVYAESKYDPNKPTVLIYGHNDVQPVQGQKWEVEGKVLDPFNPFLLGGKLYGRGTADDKGQVIALMLGLKAAKAVTGELPVNVKFLIESNEESSQGPLLDDWIVANKEMLKADGVVIADCERKDNGDRPMFATALKGIAAAKVTMDHHRPLALGALLSELYDPDSCKTTLPGFYSAVADRGPITDTELLKLMKETPEMGAVLTPEKGVDQATHRARRPTYDPLSFMYANPSPVEAEGHTIKVIAHGPNTFLHSGDFGGPVQNPGLYLARVATALMKIHTTGGQIDVDYVHYGSRDISTKIAPTGEMQFRLSFNRKFDNKFALGVVRDTVNTYWEGNGDKGLLTYEIVPDEQREAHLQMIPFNKGDFGKPQANVSFRLVANQDPLAVLKSLETFVRARAATLSDSNPGFPFSTDVENPFCKALISASQEVYQAKPLFFEEGGSIPIANTLAKIGPVLLYALGPAESHIHDANERVHPEELYKGAAAFAVGLTRFAEHKKAWASGFPNGII